MILQLTPFIMLDGTAKEAIRFYEQALGAQVVFTQTYGESPDAAERPVQEDAKERLAHSILKVGEADLFVSDTFPGQPLQAGGQVYICITTADAASSEQYYESLKQGGTVNFPLQQTHFSPAYGIVTDRFGVTFQIFTKR